MYSCQCVLLLIVLWNIYPYLCIPAGGQDKRGAEREWCTIETDSGRHARVRGRRRQ